MVVKQTQHSSAGRAAPHAGLTYCIVAMLLAAALGAVFAAYLAAFSVAVYATFPCSSATAGIAWFPHFRGFLSSATCC